MARTQDTQYFYFVGVTTAKSSINQVFPLWMEVLGFPHVVLKGIDHPIHADPAAYRQTVQQIKDDPRVVGGLVTTHKMDLYAAASDLFEYLDPYARITHELSSISKHGGQLRGHAKDPISSGTSLKAITGAGYFGRTGGDMLCLGAGGAALALLLYLITRPDAADRPRTFTAVDISQARLDHLREMVGTQTTDIDVRYVCTADAHTNDALLAALPAGSIVINATGMGKDTPGSPLTDAAVFPEHGIVWEFNYRGQREFMQQALRQAAARHLHVEDGWVYFIHGWTQVVFEVLGLEMTPERFAELDRAASSVRAAT